MTVSNNVKEIQAKLDENFIEDFVRMEVPELLFWELGLEYVDTDTVRVII